MQTSYLDVLRILADQMPDLEQNPNAELIVRLTWLATIISAISFQSEEANEGSKKQVLLDYLTQDELTLIKTARALNLSLTRDVEEQRIGYLELPPIRITIDKLGHLPKPALDAWIDKAWEHGVMQHRIYKCEIEGSVQSTVGIVSNFAANLVLFGTQYGLLPTTEETAEVS